jgi:hypothetical protein
MCLLPTYHNLPVPPKYGPGCTWNYTLKYYYSRRDVTEKAWKDTVHDSGKCNFF